MKKLLVVFTLVGLLATETLYHGTAADSKTPLPASDIRIGAAAAELEADDSMVIGGGIGPGKAVGQEGKLRAVAVVIEKPNQQPPQKVAIVACDILMINRDYLDPAAEEIEKTCGIPASNVLINATHTHHAPTTASIHGYRRDELFCRRVQQGVVKAVRDANSKLVDASFWFRLGEESSIGQNSRLLLSDGGIYWGGPRDDEVRPTGPFDPELPVLAFRTPEKRFVGTIFNHSVHTIGVRTPGKRSPAFYGLAAQELEEELGGVFCFLEGASGSTHRLDLRISVNEMILRVKNAVKEALDLAEPRPVTRLVAIKRKLDWKVRKWDEAVAEEAVARYCKKRYGQAAESIMANFRDQRKELSPHQGETRTTWVQAVLIGDVAIVGVPAEFFTKLGQEIKRRSPFRYTYVAELANDYVGYLPDKKGHELGGYQTWVGLHCPAEPGTGEIVVAEAVKMLNELAR